MTPSPPLSPESSLWPRTPPAALPYYRHGFPWTQQLFTYPSFEGTLGKVALLATFVFLVLAEWMKNCMFLCLNGIICLANTVLSASSQNGFFQPFFSNLK